jgi:thiol-disulfide isomerase/thioredoxin
VRKRAVSPVTAQIASTAFATEEVSALRPAVGDEVIILDTLNTREYCSHMIGMRDEIFIDDVRTPHQPYQVKSSTFWLYPDDVQIVETFAAKEARKPIARIIPGMTGSRKLIHLDDTSQYKAQIEEAATKNRPVVICHFASWCRTCKATKPKVLKVMGKFPDVDFYDIEFDKPLGLSLGIKSLPYFEVYLGKYGKVEEFQVGPQRIPFLEEKLDFHTGCGDFPCNDLTESAED